MTPPNLRRQNHRAIRTFRGFARYELLLVMASLSLLVATQLPVGEAVRIQTMADKCRDNLRRLGQISFDVAMLDGRNIPHRQSTSGQIDWVGLGAWDWGGADGLANFKFDDGSPTHLGAETRPYNQFVDPAAEFESYRCPADTGFGPNATNIFSIYAQAKWSAFEAAGTSYWGEAFHGGFTEPLLRNHWGSFMRPYEMFEAPEETLLLYDARLMQAIYHSDEAGFGSQRDVPSWHRLHRHNALMVDGHLNVIELNRAGSVMPQTTFPVNQYPFRDLMWRGSGWRYDAFPKDFVLEYYGEPGDPRDP